MSIHQKYTTEEIEELLKHNNPIRKLDDSYKYSYEIDNSWPHNISSPTTISDTSTLINPIRKLDDAIYLQEPSYTSPSINSAEIKDMINKRTGQKFSSKKAPMGKLLKQFPLALEAVAQRSKSGHNKYKETDHDWMNFKRVPNAIEEYDDAIVRHLAGIGEPHETELDHLKAAAWNILAKLQLILEKDGF